MEVNNDQLQLVTAASEAPVNSLPLRRILVKNHGWRYIESINRAVDIIAEA